MQALPESHSESIRHPTARHTAFGFPSKPGSHEHIARWFCTWHVAWIPQSHGLRHWRLIHDSWSGHSLSCWQPGGDGRTMRRHSPFWSGTQSSGHSQTIVRTGALSRTLHLAVWAQGVNSWHGFTQRLRMQANLLGQSKSTRQSGSVSCTIRSQ